MLGWSVSLPWRQTQPFQPLKRFILYPFPVAVTYESSERRLGGTAGYRPPGAARRSSAAVAL